MKYYLKNFIIFLALTTGYSVMHAQEGRWKSEIDFGDGFVLTTFLKVNKTQSKFVMTSPPNADKRLVSGIKSVIGRMFGKLPKQGVLLTIEGSVIGDSLVGIANASMLGKMQFKGVFENDVIKGNFFKEKKSVGSLNGIKSDQSEIDYVYLYPKIIELTESKIYSKEVLETKDWKEFDKSLKRLLNTAKDDIELFIGFNIFSQKLPFSHYNLTINKKEERSEEENQDEDDLQQNNDVEFEEKSDNTVYLKIKNFSRSEHELAEILPQITQNKNYHNLIIDLRDNGGGGIEAAFEFAKHLISDSVNIGYFVTNKFVYSEFKEETFDELPDIIPNSTEEFIDFLKNGKGGKLVFSSTDVPVFSGKLYVLTNRRVGSTCEPIVYILKNKYNATVIGEKTAGAMLSAAPFILEGKYNLFMPIADFYTYDGQRLERNGVAPNIETASEEALEKALEIIEKSLK